MLASTGGGVSSTLAADLYPNETGPMKICWFWQRGGAGLYIRYTSAREVKYSTKIHVFPNGKYNEKVTPLALYTTLPPPPDVCMTWTEIWCDSRAVLMNCELNGGNTSLIYVLCHENKWSFDNGKYGACHTAFQNPLIRRSSRNRFSMPKTFKSVFCIMACTTGPLSGLDSENKTKKYM